jgi:uncharacterized membrane protein YfcA
VALAKPPLDFEMLLDAASGPVAALFAAWLSGLVLLSFQSHVLVTLNVLGFVGAFIAGLVGVGGAIVMIPLLLYVPPLLGFEALAMHTIAGITMVQVAVAGAAGMLAHRRARQVAADVVLTLGLSVMLAAFGGAVFSRFVSARLLTVVFAMLATVAAGMLVAGGPRIASREPGELHLNRPLAVFSGLMIGLLVGMVGAGGGFLLVPVMLLVLHIPLRIAVGTSLAIVALGGLSGSIGKALTGQVDWLLSLALVVGALPGGHFGAATSRFLSVRFLVVLLGLLIGLVTIRLWWDVLAR